MSPYQSPNLIKQAKLNLKTHALFLHINKQDLHFTFGFELYVFN